MFDDQNWVDVATTLVIPLLALLIGVVGSVLLGPVVGIALALVYLVWRFAREA